jgi:hypothetical protein
MFLALSKCLLICLFTISLAWIFIYFIWFRSEQHVLLTDHSVAIYGHRIDA